MSEEDVDVDGGQAKLSGSEVYGYVFETRMMGGPDRDRPLGDWKEQVQETYPDSWINTEIRDVRELVPAGSKEPEYWYYEYLYDKSGEWKTDISTYDPNKRVGDGYLSADEVRAVVGLVVGEEVDAPDLTKGEFNRR